MAGSSAEVPNDIENPPIQLEMSMKQELDSLSPLTESCCIYRVPERLRRGKPNAYTPQVVSIGPIHHGNKGLIAMEEHKKRYLQDFICRTGISLENYLVRIRDHEQELRNCYAETIGLKTDDFVKIILVDAAFIIELLLKYHFKNLRDKSDRIFNKPWMLQDVWPDLRLLENQLPFFILDKLFDIDRINGIEMVSLVDLSHHFFQSMMQIEGTGDKLKQIRSSSELEHFVDFVRHLYLTPQEPQAQPAKAKVTSTPATATTPTAFTMTELHWAGVKFKVRTSENLFDIKFHDGTLEIPKLAISDETEVTIRNLVAFEQCHCEENYINDYVVMMDQLVNTSEDVELLVKYGIVENRLGDNSAGASLINNLADGVLIESKYFQYATICEGLHQHCKKHRNRWKANLCHKYFNTPWAGISVAAAVVIIVLTIIQTVFSGMSLPENGQN